VHVLMLLVLYLLARKSGTPYGVVVWPIWLLVVSWLVAPFWFNPLGFSWDKLTEDATDFWLWLQRGEGNSTRSWVAWVLEENQSLKSMGPRQRAASVALQLRHVVVGVGVLYWQNVLWEEVLFACALVALAVLVPRAFSCLCLDGNAQLERAIKALVLAALFSGAVALAIGTGLGWESIGRAPLTVLGVLHLLGFAVGAASLLIGFHPVVLEFFRIFDLLVGAALLAALAVLSLLRFPGYVQTRVMFHRAFSRGLLIDRLLQSRANASFAPADVVAARSRANAQPAPRGAAAALARWRRKWNEWRANARAVVRSASVRSSSGFGAASYAPLPSS
jgi:callose synthase